MLAYLLKPQFDCFSVFSGAVVGPLLARGKWLEAIIAFAIITVVHAVVALSQESNQ